MNKFLLQTKKLLAGMLLIALASSSISRIALADSLNSALHLSKNTTHYNDPPHNLTPLASMGGQVLDVVVQGNYAFAGFGSKLTVFDATNPAEMVEVASLILYDRMVDMDLTSQYLYILTKEEGLLIINIHDPLKPQKIGYYAMADATGLAVEGNYAYIAAGYGGLEIVDVSDPRQPFQAAQYYQHTNEILEVVLSGDFAYIYENNFGIKIFEISNPLTPVPVGSYTVQYGTGTATMVVADTYLYLLKDWTGLQVLDISTPSAPKLLGEFPMSVRGMDLALGGEFIYLAWETFPWPEDVQQGGLMILDISNPANPVLVGSTTTPGTFFGVAAVGDFVLLTRQNLIYHSYSGGDIYGGELQSVDVSDPTAPVIAYSISNQLTQPGSIAIQGNYAYFAENHAGMSSSKIYVMDVTSPAEPILLGSLETPGFVNDIAVAGSIAFVTEIERLDASGQSTGGGFRVLNVSDPMVPVEIGFLDDGIGQFLDVEVQGSYAYLTWKDDCPNDECTGRLQVVAITDPAHPEELGFYESTGLQKDVPFKVFVQDNYAYVAAWRNLWILDISDPDHPREVARPDDIGAADVAVANDYAYLALSLGGVSIVNLQDRAHPVLIGVIPLLGNVTDITVDGNILYAAAAPWDIWAFDISDPANPIELASFPSHPGIPHIEVSDGIIYFTNDVDGLFLLKLTSRIDGVVQHANRMPASGVTITANDLISTTTAGEGYYWLEDLDAGSYSVVPFLPGYVFSPEQRQVNAPPDAGANFTLLPVPVSADLSPEITTTVTYTDTQWLPTSLSFPAGAVAAATSVVVTPTISNDMAGSAFAGHAFELAAYQGNVIVPDLSFSAPISVTIQYSPLDAALVSDKEALALWWWDGAAWQDAAQTCQPPGSPQHDLESGRYQVAICRTGLYALYGPTKMIYLPEIIN